LGGPGILLSFLLPGNSFARLAQFPAQFLAGRIAGPELNSAAIADRLRTYDEPAG